MPTFSEARGATIFNTFFLTDAQNATYWMFDSILNYGVVVVLCVAAFMWLLQKINKASARQ